MTRTIAPDIRLAMRRLKSRPLLTGAIVLTFGLAIGLSTTIYSTANSILLRPFPFTDPGRLLSIWRTAPGVDFIPLPAPELLDLRSRTGTLEDVAGFEPGGFGVRLADRTVWASAFSVTANWFDVLGVRPVIGRTLDRRDDRTGHDTVVVTERFWRNELGADPGIIGRRLHVVGQGAAGNDASLEIVGVVRDDIELSYPTYLRADAYVPRVLTPADLDVKARSSPALITMARMRRGVSPADASEEVRALTAAFSREHAATSMPNTGVRTVLLHEELVGRTRPMFLLLGAAALVLLFIATANVTAVLLAVVSSRRSEIGVRAALGCSRSRLVRMVVVESAVLAALSASVGLLVSLWTIPLLRAIAPERLPRAGEIRMDPATLCFGLAVTLAGAIVFGIIPALAAAVHSANAELSLRGGIAGGGRKSRFAHAIVMAETALVIALLSGAASIGRGIWRLTHIDLGFDPRQIVVAVVTLPRTSDTQIVERQVLERIRVLPGVLSVSATSELPFSSGVLVGVGTSVPGNNPRAVVAAVDSDYFPLLRMRARSGRLLASGDVANRGVVVLNDTLARTVGESGAIGGRVKIGGQWREVIGVVSDVTEVGSVRAGIIRQAGFSRLTLPTAYIPRGTGYLDDRTLLLARTTLPPAQLAAAVRRALHSVDPSLVIRRVGTLEERVAAPGTDARIVAAAVATFGFAALVIASVGLYGLLAQSVHQRTREVAVRVALGATRSQILRSVTGRTLAVVLTGLALGLASTVVTGPLLRPWLFETPAASWHALLAAAAVLVFVTLIATIAPAHRRFRINPIAALRAE